MSPTQSSFVISIPKDTDFNEPHAHGGWCPSRVTVVWVTFNPTHQLTDAQGFRWPLKAAPLDYSAQWKLPVNLSVLIRTLVFNFSISWLCCRFQIQTFMCKVFIQNFDRFILTVVFFSVFNSCFFSSSSWNTEILLKGKVGFLNKNIQDKTINYIFHCWEIKSLTQLRNWIH